MQDPFDHLLIDILRPHTETIIDAFYTTLLNDPQARVFLDHQQVNQRLRPALITWLLDTLATPVSDTSNPLRERQIRIGDIHARINVPLRLVNRGIALIKQQCGIHLRDSDTDREQLAELLIRLHQRLDHAMGLINDTYLQGAMDHDRHNQSLRTQLIDNSLAIECERLRSGMFDWMRRNALQLYRQEPDQGFSPESLSSSELGLWIIHKAELLFPDMDMVHKLKAETRRVDDLLARLVDGWRAENHTRFRSAMEMLDQAVTNTGWMLSTLAEHVLESERCRDPLTRVLSRRFMTTTLQREVRISQETQIPFALLMIDIDHFKTINDRYGHDAGDVVLSEAAELIMTSARATDFVFRYGGEEFLMVFNGATRTTALEMAERLRERVLSHRFTIPQEPDLRISVSIGVALFQGHPDYQRVLNQADQALLQAKQTGRDRCVLHQAISP